MALPTIDAVSGGFAGAGSLTWSHTVGAGGDVLYAWLQQGRTDFDIETVTFGGVSMTKQGSTVTDGNSRLSLWRLTGPTPSTANIVATMEFSSTAQIRGISVSMADVDTATYNDAAVTATAALAVGDTITSDQMFLVGFGYYDAEGPGTQTIGVSGTSQTLRRQESDAFGTTGLGVSSQTGSGAVTSTFTYNHTAEGRSLLGIAVNGVAEPPPVGSPITISFRPPA